MLNEIIIGLKIANLRKQQEVTQTALAEVLGVSSQAVSKWESGQSMPDIVMLDKIAKHFDMDLDYFTVDLGDISVDDIEDKIKEGTIDKVDATNSSSDNANSKQNNDFANDQQRNKSFDMAYSNWKNSDFSKLKNVGGKFSCSNIFNCKFDGSELQTAKFSANLIKDSSFENAYMQQTKFVAASLNKSSFVGTDFDGAVFKATLLVENNFCKANLSNTSFKSTQINKCDFRDSNFADAEFKNCKLKDVNITSDINGASFIGVTFKNVVFEKCKFTNTLFKNNKLGNTKFVDCTADSTTYSFLQSCKDVNLDGVTKI